MQIAIININLTVCVSKISSQTVNAAEIARMSSDL